MLLEKFVENESYGEPSRIGEGLQLLKFARTNADRVPFLPGLLQRSSFLAHQQEYTRRKYIFKRCAVLCLTMLDYPLYCESQD